MRSINFKEQILPHLVAVVLFLLVTVVYFKPVFFENKSLGQHDIQQWQGSAKELIDYRKTSGDEALWTNSMFSGMPAYLINVEWGNKIIGVFQRVASLGLPHPVRIVFLSFVSFYILLLAFGVRPYLAIAGALAFGLSSYNIVGLTAGHNARISAVAFMPLVLAGIRLVFKGNNLLGFSLTALAVAMELRVNHLQITYYLLLMAAAYGISELVVAIKEKQLTPFIKRSSLLVGAGILGLATFIGSFLSTMEYTKYSMRGKSEITMGTPEEKTDGLTKEYAFRYSNGIFEPMTLFMPNALGGSSQQKLSTNSATAEFMRKQGVPRAQVDQQIQVMPTYWGEQPLAAPYYAGAIIVFLFVLGIIVLPAKQTVWLIIVSILGIMLSWGYHFNSFNYFMFDYFPGYNKFRSVTFAIIMPILAMNLLGFIGLEKVLSQEWNPKTKRQLFIALGSTGGLALLLWLFAGIFSYRGAVDAQLPDWLLAPLREDRQSLFKASALAAFFLTGITFAGIWFTLNKRIKPSILYLTIAGLILIDHWVTDKKLLNDDNFSKNPTRSFFQKTEADQLILNDKTLDFRVFNLANPWNEARTSYYHHSLGGYHGAKIRRYQDLIDKGLSVEHQEAITKLRSGSVDFSDLGVINMLNTRYLVAGPSKDAVIKNNFANGNAWFVSDIKSVSNPDEELNETVKVNTKITAVIDASKFSTNNLPTDDYGIIKLTKYEPNHLVYTSENGSDALGVFSEIYYKDGWIATIDGKKAPIIRADYVLRALEIPEGTHTIEFTFKPTIYQWANPVMAASSWLILLLLLGTLGVELGFIKLKSKNDT